MDQVVLPFLHHSKTKGGDVHDTYCNYSCKINKMEVLLPLHHIKTKSGHVHNKQKVEVFMRHTTIKKAEVLLTYSASSLESN